MGKKTQPKLHKELISLDWLVRYNAAKTLGAFSKPSKNTIKVLIEALEDSCFLVRVASIVSLGSFESKARDAVEPLCSLLVIDDKHLHQKISKTLLSIGKPSANVLVNLIGGGSHFIARETLIKLGSEAVDSLISHYQNDSSEDVRGNILEILKEIGTEAHGAIQLLISILKNDENGFVKSCAAKALGHIRGSAIDELGSLLEDENTSNILKEYTIVGIRFAGPEAGRLAAKLMPYIEKDDQKIVEEALSALQAMGEVASAVSRPLVEKFASIEYDKAHKHTSAITAIGKSCVPFLLIALEKCTKKEKKIQIIEALHNIRLCNQDLEKLTRRLLNSEGAVREKILWLFQDYSVSSDVVDVLIQTLGNESDELRRFLTFQVIRNASEKTLNTIPPLLAAIESDSLRCKQEAAAALASVELSETDVQGLIDLFSDTEDEETKKAISTTFQLLGSKAKAALPVLAKAAFESSKNSLTHSAILAIGRMEEHALLCIESFKNLYKAQVAYHDKAPILLSVLRILSSLPDRDQQREFFKFADEKRTQHEAYQIITNFIENEKNLRYRSVPDKELVMVYKKFLRLLSDEQVREASGAYFPLRPLRREEKQAFLKEYEDLSKIKDPQKRGYDFEKFLNRLFSSSGIRSRESFRKQPKGEQYDGRLKIYYNDYIYEAKWKQGKTPPSEIRDFSGKLDGRPPWTYGIFISANGFEESCQDTLQRSTKIICLSGQDIEKVLSSQWQIYEAIDWKLSRASDHLDFLAPLPNENEGWI